jgi:replicative DNA helicase
MTTRSSGAGMKGTLQKVETEEDVQRLAPHNAEAERQLLGAILVNNETFYRVSDFLEPHHFFVPPHQDVYEKIGHLIRAGKTASPITLKTFYPADAKIADLSATQFLLRLAGDAASIINAEDYGRTIYDLAIRRNLIRIGEDMVNIAFDAPIDVPPEQQIDDAERRLFELAETGAQRRRICLLWRCADRNHRNGPRGLQS